MLTVNHLLNDYLQLVNSFSEGKVMSQSYFQQIISDLEYMSCSDEASGFIVVILNTNTKKISCVAWKITIK